MARKTKRRKSTKRRTTKRRKAVRRAPARRRKATRKKTVKRKKRRGGGGLTKQKCCLSPALQAVCRGNNLSRPEIMKKFWAYIKSHKCQDSRNRRMINPDKKLAAVIGNRPVDMLKLAGCISRHIKK